MNEHPARIEKSDSTSTTGGKQSQRSAPASRTHPPRPLASTLLDRKVSFNNKTDNQISRESSQGTLDGEGILMEEGDSVGKETPFTIGAAATATSGTSNMRSPMLSSVSYPVRHDRNSSLDAFSLGMESADGSPTNISQRKTSIDIKTINPLESEAETLILKALDRQDQHQQAQTANISLLGNIPDKTAEIFRSNSHLSSESHHTNTLDRPARNRAKTMEDELAILSDTLVGLHNDIIDKEDLVIPEDLHEDDGDQVVRADGPAGETLAKTAKLLYRGRNRTTSEAWLEGSNEDTKDNDSKQSGDESAKSKWSKLRKAVSIRKGLGMEDLAGTPKETDTGTLDDHKKTDGKFGVNGDVEQGGVLDTSEATSDDNKGKEQKGTKRRRRRHRHHRFNQAQPGVVRDLQIFLSQRRTGFLNYVRFLVLVIVPSVAVAFCFYYLGGNPPYGRISRRNSSGGILVSESGELVDPASTSISWWILFVGVRQALIFSLAQLIQVFFIDFLCLNTRFFVQIFGNLVTLFIVQSKGWPFLCLCWASLSFGLLHGDYRFSNHWLYFQDWVGIFNEKNPGGSATVSIWYTRILFITILLSFLVAVKRLVVGLYLGKKTYSNYAGDLTQTVKKVLMLSEVASLARQCHIESMNSQVNKPRRPQTISERVSTEQLRGLLTTESRSNDGKDVGDRRREMADQGPIDSSDRIKIRDLLGDWEDPELVQQNQDKSVTINSILQFRQSLSLLNTAFIFSIAWGDVSSREAMVLSSEEVYRRLMYRSMNPDVLTFDVLSLICRGRTKLDQSKLKDLIRLLRPDRNGNLTLLDFVKSVDSVYKEVKLLRATIKNSEKIDLALERFINIVFYTVTGCVFLSQLGFNPFNLFLSLSSIILAFAFMIGSAASKMCEGWLFILIRRPYGIGDRIHIAGSESESSPDGSASWVVQDVTLFHTVAVYGSTNEQATISNGSLASSRVINMARSPNPLIHVNLSFSVDTPHDKIKLFESTLREFVRERPREWRAFEAFRVTSISVERGVVEYKMLLTHREPWQSIGVVLQSKADVASFCLELTKKLNMRYSSPPLPVDLSMSNRDKQGAEMMIQKSTASSDPTGFPDSATLHRHNT